MHLSKLSWKLKINFTSYKVSLYKINFKIKANSKVEKNENVCVFPGSSDAKASAYNAGDPGSIPGLGRSPGEGNGNPLQYSCLENPMAREACRLQSMGSQRVKHDWATSLSLHFLCYTFLKHCNWVLFVVYPVIFNESHSTGTL